jgi:hypothetical protein
MAEHEETARARYTAGNVATQLMLKALFEHMERIDERIKSLVTRMVARQPVR